ncbi:MAG TPA: hypothetical protein VLI54_03250 [Bacillota bacterium]|nr:hypothetical protein [Bacillota bacterium]
MPIIGIRPFRESGWLIAPYPPLPRAADVILGWLGAREPCELVEYGPDYLGDITPGAWRGINNFLLNVDPSGERGEMTVARVLPSERSPDDILAQVRAANVQGHAAFESVATIDETSSSASLAVAMPNSKIAIGGLLLYVSRAELTDIRLAFPSHST